MPSSLPRPTNDINFIMPPQPVPEANNDSQVTLRGTAAQVPAAQAPDGQAASVAETPIFGPMSPAPGDLNDYFGAISSPEPMPPTVPSTRRSSAVDSSFYGTPSLSRFTSNTSEVSESVFSEGSAAPWAELDRKLEKLVLEEEPKKVKNIPAADIPTEIPDELKHAPYTFDCAFGWTGNHSEDLEDHPITKKAFVEKLAEAKQGTEFVANALIAYQSEINSRRHHKFPTGFLAHQNHAIVVTNDQLDTINEKLDAVIAEVKAIHDDDENIKAELVDAYKHAAPWMKRTQRIIYDAHVFYKLNYTMGGAKAKAVKKKTSPVSTFDPIPFAADLVEVDVPGSMRNGK